MPKLLYAVAVILLMASIGVHISCANSKKAPAQTTLTPNPNSPVPAVGANPVIDVKGVPGQPQSVDFMSGKPISRAVFTDYSGERIYFCCDESRKTFLKNPQMYHQRIKEKGIILEKAPTQ